MNFGFGPMSTEIIEAIYQYSHEHRIELMLIASKNQIDYDGGYVNNWNTRLYTEYLTKLQKIYPDSKIMICRDHCGPGFKHRKNIYCGKSSKEDSKNTIREDINCGFDLIHIDLCHYTFIGNIIQETCNLLEFAENLNPDIEFEIGTDDISEKIIDTTQWETELHEFLKFDPIYYVVNTGSRIMENQQIGTFDKQLTQHLHHCLRDYGIGLKEHNADYLSASQIKLRHNCVDAMNIAPQLGVVQTSTVLHEAQKYGIKVDDFINLVYNSNRWKKWDHGNLTGNPYFSTVVAGHYHYTSDEYKKLIDELHSIKHHKDECVWIENQIIQNIKDVINHYVGISRFDWMLKDRI